MERITNHVEIKDGKINKPYWNEGWEVWKE